MIKKNSAILNLKVSVLHVFQLTQYAYYLSNNLCMAILADRFYTRDYMQNTRNLEHIHSTLCQKVGGCYPTTPEPLIAWYDRTH